MGCVNVRRKVFDGEPHEGWGFLTTHGLVVTCVGQRSNSTGQEIAQTVGVTERTVRNILADLHAAGYITSEKMGRRNRYRIDGRLPLLRLGERAEPPGHRLY